MLGIFFRGISLNEVNKMYIRALADVVQWVECQPVSQRVTGSIPSEGTCLGFRPGPQYRVCERQPHIDVSLLLFIFLFPSL